MPESTRRRSVLPSRSSTGSALVIAAGLTLAAAPARAQSTADLARFSVEDLMRLEVTSVSKKERPLATSPAAVFVLTHDDIRRSGLTSLPEVLRLVPGLHIARIDGSKWAVSARGFNGRFANKLLVLVDGRSVYSPLYSGVFWDEVDVPLEDIERIEVIRGPGATMWGANAVNGVINVITRPAGSTPGTSVTVAAGTADRLAASARYGGTAGNGLSWRAWAKAFDRGPLASAAGGDAHDGWRMGRTGFRADYRASDIDDLTVQGDVYSGRVDQTSSVAQLAPPYRRVFDEVADLHGRNVLARWTRRHSPQSESSLQVFGDHTRRREFLIGHARTTFDAEFQHRQTVGARHDVVWGLNYRRGRSTITNSEIVQFADTEIAEWLAGAFVEDEIAVLPERLTLALGVKVERHGFSGVELQPNVRTLWAISPRDSLWVAATRGVRTPSLLENGANVQVAAAPGPFGLTAVATVVGNRTAHAEELWATELGYRRHWSRLSMDVSTFRNRYSHLMSFAPGAPELVAGAVPYVRLPHVIAADLHGRAYGIEAASTWRATPDWTLTAGYAHVSVDLTSDGTEGDIAYEDTEDDSPRHQFSLRSQASLGRRWELDGALYVHGRFDRDRVPGHARLDLRAGWKATSHLTVSLSGLDLLEPRHTEFRSVLNEQVSLPRRSVHLQTRWTF